MAALHGGMRVVTVMCLAIQPWRCNGTCPIIPHLAVTALLHLLHSGLQTFNDSIQLGSTSSTGVLQRLNARDQSLWIFLSDQHDQIFVAFLKVGFCNSAGISKSKVVRPQVDGYNVSLPKVEIPLCRTGSLPLCPKCTAWPL